MVLTVATVLFIISAILAIIAAMPISTGGINLLSLSVAFMALGLAASRQIG